MSENTFTFTARSQENPDKLAMFTLRNGDVSVQLGDAMVEQIEDAFDAMHDDVENKFKAWLKPVATGSLQQVMKPFPLRDFSAELSGDTLQTTAWVRVGGLRLAPVIMKWEQVDNPNGAEAFVEEVQERKAAQESGSSLTKPLDYWMTWGLVVMAMVIVPVVFWRLRPQLDQN
jgi:hypothetical protein